MKDNKTSFEKLNELSHLLREHKTEKIKVKELCACANKSKYTEEWWCEGSDGAEHIGMNGNISALCRYCGSLHEWFNGEKCERM